MTPSAPIRIVVLAVALMALSAPLAQADRGSDNDGRSQAVVPPDVFERAVLRARADANASHVQSHQVAPPDVFERAVRRAQAERAVTVASGHGLAPSHGRMAHSCYDAYLDAVRVDGRCGVPSTKDRQLQVVDPGGKRLRANGSLFVKMI